MAVLVGRTRSERWRAQRTTRTRSLLEPIRRELGASDTEMGLLMGFGFVLFFALASVPIARGRPALPSPLQ
jgi:hypothetical protein